jgi:hypothetical protein
VLPKRPEAPVQAASTRPDASPQAAPTRPNATLPSLSKLTKTPAENERPKPPSVPPVLPPASPGAKLDKHRTMQGQPQGPVPGVNTPSPKVQPPKAPGVGTQPPKVPSPKAQAPKAPDPKGPAKDAAKEPDPGDSEDSIDAALAQLEAES